MIYKVTYKGQEAFIYLLIEFQSTVDRFMALRMSRYIHEFYEILSKKPRINQLPAVFPIMLYNGDDKWTAETSLRKLITPSIPDRYIPDFEYYKVIENEYSKDFLKDIKNVISAVFYAETSTAEDLRQNAEDVIQLIENEDPALIHIFRMWLRNLFKTSNEEYDAGILSKVEELQEVRTMLATEINRVRQEAIQTRNFELAKQMLEDGEPLDKIERYTKLSLNEIKKLMQ